MAKVGFGTFFGFLGSRRMVSGTKRARFLMILSPVGNLTGSIFPWRINLEQPYGKSWVWHVFMAVGVGNLLLHMLVWRGGSGTCYFIC